MGDPTAGVQKVGARGGIQDDYNFNQEMQGAKPGEVRGFENDDGTKAYVMRSDGNTSCKKFANYVFNQQEKMGLDPDQLRSVAKEMAMKNGLQNLDPDDNVPANQDIVCQLRDFANLVKKNDSAMKQLRSGPQGGTANMSAGSKKAIGLAHTPAMGLPDEDF